MEDYYVYINGDFHRHIKASDIETARGRIQSNFSLSESVKYDFEYLQYDELDSNRKLEIDCYWQDKDRYKEYHLQYDIINSYDCYCEYVLGNNGSLKDEREFEEMSQIERYNVLLTCFPNTVKLLSFDKEGYLI